LKVAEAEALGYDTTSTFIAEFRKYRDMQLTPLLVDSVFIENRAKDYYANMLAQLNGKALLSCSHILLRVASKASDAELKQASLKADSIYQLLLNGADFSELAKQYSMDPGSASKGGKLPWIGPGSTLKEFEAAAYSLKVGEISQPTLSPVGYHIIRLEETKNLDLESKGIYLGKADNLPETVSCFQDGDQWVIQEINDRQTLFEKRGSEEEIVRKMMGRIKLRTRR
jgi:peptidyl-prolyl cis-trans isomerase SurA